MRCVSWIAVSSKPQSEKESPFDQAEQNAALVEQLGGVLVATLEVPGESREIISFEDACARIEAYAQLRAIIDGKGADLLICRDLSRLGRTTALIMQVVSYCHAAGIAIYSRSAPPSSLDAATQSRSEGAGLMLALEGAMSQAEMIRLRARNRMGTIGRVKRGLPPRGPSYGYVTDADRGIAVEPAQARVVQRIFDAYVLRGWSANRIARDLTGIPSPRGGDWSPGSVLDVVGRAMTYAGWAFFNAGTETLKVRGQWTPIIDEKTARQALDERAGRSKARRSVTGRRFSRAVVCDHCGDAVYAHSVNSAGNQSYGCRNHCRGSFILERKITEALEVAIRYLSNRAAIDEILDATPDETARLRDEQAQLQAQADAVAGQRKRLLRAYSLESIDEGEYIDMMADLERSRSLVAARLSQLDDRLESAESLQDRRERYEQAAQAGLEVLSLEDDAQVNRWVRSHFRIYVKDNQVSRIQWL